MRVVPVGWRAVGPLLPLRPSSPPLRAQRVVIRWLGLGFTLITSVECGEWRETNIRTEPWGGTINCFAGARGARGREVLTRVSSVGSGAGWSGVKSWHT